ncbi:zinc finger C2HC domain-containing protein 1C [Tiliqua scincoides]|uniref:zinc finger C2HC domain-containing protein 1C n=1 Tax=Tiliqua scincoides TaxID=71010 RepID=UPI003462E454
MAQLQLAVCSHMDPVLSNSSLPETSQERCCSEAVKEQSQLEHLRTNIQQQFLGNKDKKLKDLHISIGRHASYSQSAESSQLSLEKAGFYSAGPHNWYLKSQAHILPAQWRAKRREGVDRAYPLKPVLHHKAGNSALPSSQQLGSPPVTEIPSSSQEKGKSIAVKTQSVGVPFSVEESKRAASHSQRAEPGYIQKLEAAGRSLEEEIQRKEALLKEKLRRTEEELRRIQWERQQAEAKARKGQGEIWTPERKAASTTQDYVSRSTIQPGDGQRVNVPENSIVTALFPQALHMERLKKQRLVASNSKIRANVSQETPATQSPELTSSNGQVLLAAVSLGQVDCIAAEPPHMETPSSTENLGECRFCGRKLYCSRLKKHMSICSRNHGSKRKVFDSSKARAKGTELETYHLLKGSDTSQKKSFKQSTEIPKQSNWRQKHESFIQTLRRAREVQRVVSKGGKASDLPPVPAMENPDYKLCPYCTRQFAPKVAERHIPKCKNIKNRPPPPQQKRHC